MPPTREEGDTIVVKGEYAWDRPSSPESMSPEVEPVATNLLPEVNTPQQLESPGPLENRPPSVSESKDPPGARATFAVPNPNKRQRTNVMTTEERLLAMPEKRPLPWRPGVDAGADIETGGDSRRKQIRFGCLLATRGDVVPTPCISCANGRGKFSICVADSALFRGACAGCQLSGRPNRCSIKQGDDAQSPGTKTPDTASKRQKKKSIGSAPTLAQAVRRHTDEGSSWESAQPQWQQDVSVPQPRQPTTNEVPVGQPWATVNSPVPTQTAPPVSSAHNGIRPHPPGTWATHGSVGWAAVNQQRATSISQTSNGVESSGGSLRKNSEHERPEEGAANDEGTTLIDALPKNKQRQVYGLLSGLQGGIEHLQRELDSLKKALGIDQED